MHRQQLVCVHVNHGLMRKNESESVVKVFRDELHANLIYVDASERFLGKLENVADPEQKRKIIGGEFIRVFEEEARKLEGIDFLGQGTIYPDIIESGTKTAKMVKSHHNVGGLPEDLSDIIKSKYLWILSRKYREIRLYYADKEMENMDKNIYEEIRLIDNILQAEDFIRLRIQAGFVEIPVEHARKALRNGLINVSAIYNGELVGMGRLVGDGAMYWYLQEIIILPQFQRKGIGTMIVNHLVDYARENSATGKFTTIGGVSAKGKEPFYEKLGFEVISNGIIKMIEIK